MTNGMVIEMDMRFVNWWKYWKKGMDSREIQWFWIGITQNDFMEKTNSFRIDVHLINFGIIINI